MRCMATTLPSSTADETRVHEPPASEPSRASEPPRASASRGGHARALLKVALAVVLALAAGYGAGRLHGWLVAREQLEAERSAAMSAERERREELSRASELLEQLRAQRMELAAIANLHEGYRSLQLALNALDARNFGTAESSLREAERTLEPLAARVPDLQEPLQRLSALKIAVATDIGEQRRALRELSDALSLLIEAHRARSPVTP